MGTQPRQGRRALLGGLIIIALVGLVASSFLLDEIGARFRSSYTVVAVLAEAPRLAPGSRVWVGGSDVGDVRSVAMLPARGDSTRVGVVLRLPGRVREQVRQDSRVRITAVNLMGAPVIDITPGTAAAPVLAAGDTLHARPQLSSAAVMARVGRFRASLDTALAELRAVQVPLEQRLESFARAQSQLAGAQREYDRLSGDLGSSPLLAAWQTGELSAAAQRGGASVNEVLGALQQLQQRAEQTGFTGNAAALAVRSRALQTSLAELQAAMQERGGTMDRMSRDSALVRAIAAARAELDSLIADARRRPLRYVF